MVRSDGLSNLSCGAFLPKWSPERDLDCNVPRMEHDLIQTAHRGQQVTAEIGSLTREDQLTDTPDPGISNLAFVKKQSTLLPGITKPEDL